MQEAGFVGVKTAILTDFGEVDHARGQIGRPAAQGGFAHRNWLILSGETGRFRQAKLAGFVRRNWPISSGETGRFRQAILADFVHRN
jgi:hypothetical protein